MFDTQVKWQLWARVDCLTKLSDIMHLTKILNIYFIFKGKSINEIASKYCHNVYLEKLYIYYLAIMSLFSSFDKPVFVRCLTSDGFVRQSKRALSWVSSRQLDT